MRLFLWGPAEKEGMARLRAWAEENPISEERMKAIAAGTEPMPGDDACCTLPTGYRCVFSLEWQPLGFVRHLSVSTPDPGRVPNQYMMQMIMPALGFKKADVISSMRKGLAWLEDIGNGRKAVNVIEKIED